MPAPPPLPIDDALPALRAALAVHTRAVLQAPPGAGKTTRVPLALLDEPWMAGRSILMLEPRRLAARAAARRMAATLGEPVGETVGYRVRMDSRVGPRTRIEVVTEGVLPRLLQDDPALEHVGAVLFDEFHERSLQADLGLALTLDAQTVLRDDLRVVAMSATLDGARVAGLLGDGSGTPAPVIASEGRAHRVEVRWAPRRPDAARGALEGAVAATVRAAAAEHAGDVLVFLPGVAEIRRTGDPPAGRAAAAGHPRARAARPARRGRAGRGRRAVHAGGAQDRARHEHRRDQPHHRGRARGGRRRARARAALLAAHRG
jgi:ATP-dependent helicase HrpB